MVIRQSMMSVNTASGFTNVKSKKALRSERKAKKPDSVQMAMYVAMDSLPGKIGFMIKQLPHIRKEVGAGAFISYVPTEESLTEKLSSFKVDTVPFQGAGWYIWSFKEQATRAAAQSLKDMGREWDEKKKASRRQVTQTQSHFAILLEAAIGDLNETEVVPLPKGKEEMPSEPKEEFPGLGKVKSRKAGAAIGSWSKPLEVAIEEKKVEEAKEKKVERPVPMPPTGLVPIIRGKKVVFRRVAPEPISDDDDELSDWEGYASDVDDGVSDEEED